MAGNTQQFGIQGGANTSTVISGVNTFNNLRLENQLIELTSLVRQLAIRQHQQVAQRVCGICTSMEHPTDTCPILQKNELENIEFVGADSNLEDSCIRTGSLIISNFRGNRTSRIRIEDLDQPRRIKPIINSKDLGGTTGRHGEPNAVSQFWNDHLPDDSKSERELAWRGYEAVESYHTEVETQPGADSQLQQPAKSVPLSFPNRAILAKRYEIDEDLLKLFRKVEINIPLLDAIQQIPKYAKFLKELCVNRRKKMNGIVEIRGVVSSLCLNLGIFVVPCTISSRTFTDAMLDLGASINVMPASIYKLLNLGDLEPTGMEIQLANRSVVQPLGVLEDVLVQVNKLIFPKDFYVVDMEDESSRERSTLILGLPFYMTAKTKIDVKFNIIEALKHPAEDHSIFSIGAIDGLMEEYFRLGTGHASLADFVNISDIIDCFCTVAVKADSEILSNILHFSYSGNSIFDLIHCRIDEVPRNSQHAKFLFTGTNKQGVKGAANIIRAESDSRIKFQEADQAESATTNRKDHALSRFLSQSTERAAPIFNTLKNGDAFVWTIESKEAFLRLK
ncbi:hypothetical protein CR513_22509, partial [Mucuna pruriens]